MANGISTGGTSTLGGCGGVINPYLPVSGSAGLLPPYTNSGGGGGCGCGGGCGTSSASNQGSGGTPSSACSNIGGPLPNAPGCYYPLPNDGSPIGIPCVTPGVAGAPNWWH